jgi:geranylgeranyl diphosphate synthase type I
LSYDEPRIIEEVNRIAKAIDREIARIEVSNRGSLYRAAFYLPKLGGKRMRPFVVLNSSHLVRGHEEAAFSAALAVELLHNFTLVHDDIMDRDEYRRNHKTTHVVYGEATAILAGDLLFSKAFEEAAKAEELSGARGIVKELALSSEKIAEGQFLDISFERGEKVSLDDYLEMIYLKTAALYETSAVVGGLTAGRYDQDRLRMLSEFGRNLGLAFQIRDDYLGVFGDSAITGKPVGNDILRGKKSAPILLALSKENVDLSPLKRALGNPRSTHDDVVQAIDFLRRLGVDTECRRMADEFARRAVDSLSPFEDSDAKSLLSGLAYYAVARDR